MMGFFRQHQRFALAALSSLVILGIVVVGRWEAARYGTFRGLDLVPLKPHQFRNRPERTSVLAKLEEFSPARGDINGHVRITIEPDQAKNEVELHAPKSVELRLTHAIPENANLIEQGRSAGAITMQPDPVSYVPVTGEGQFRWSVVTDRSPFWYPFDRYRLYVNPELLNPENALGQYVYINQVDLIEVEVGASNLLMSATSANADSPAGSDPYEVKLKRPIIIGIMALALVVIGLGFLVHLSTVDDVGSLMWQSLTFFAGIWGVRNILLTGFPVFPVLIDYVTLTLYLLTSIILLWKRFVRKSETEDRQV